MQFWETFQECCHIYWASGLSRHLLLLFWSLSWSSLNCRVRDRELTILLRQPDQIPNSNNRPRPRL